jgi:hypothetical protein
MIAPQCAQVVAIDVAGRGRVTVTALVSVDQREAR